MTLVPVTEITELQATKVAGVTTPANGEDFLVIKAASGSDTKAATSAAAEANTNKKNVDGSKTKDADNDGDVDSKDWWAQNKEKITAKKSDSEEADQIEDELTKSEDTVDIVDYSGEYCGVPSCGVCKANGVVGMDTVLPDSEFACKGIAVHDRTHTELAMAKFAQYPFDNDQDRIAAGARIAKAASAFGISIDEAVKGAAQEALNGTAMPEVGGHFTATGQSKLAGPITTAPGVDPGINDAGLTGPTRKLEGGETPYKALSLEAAQSGPAVASPGDYVKAGSAALFMDTMDRIFTRRGQAKKAASLQVDNLVGNQAKPSMSLDEIAQSLAAAAVALDQIQDANNLQSALGGDSMDYDDVWDLQDAESALECALGIAARLAYQFGAQTSEAAKAADEDFEKAYARLRQGDAKSLQSAHDAIGQVLAAHNAKQKASSSGKNNDSEEEDDIVTTVTKSELAEMLEQAAEKGAEKAAAKAVKKALKRVAKTSANNDGDPKDEKATSEHQANDVNGAVPDGGSTSSMQAQPMSKSADEDGSDFEAFVTKSMGEVATALQTVQEEVKKFSRKPRSGGPSLDGKARQVIDQAGEGRQGQVQKSEEDQKIEQLEKSLGEATDPREKDRIGQELTLAKLTQVNKARGLV